MSQQDPSTEGPAPTIDPKRYRQVLGQYPTGVCVVAARSEDGAVTAMVVGSFSSVSLNPPLVAFFPDKSSSTWAKLRDADTFCVNILSADQEEVCRKLASKDPDKFSGIAHSLSEGGNPILDGAVAWIDCMRHSITDAGDHDLVMGEVISLDVATGELPLLFFRGGYGRFAPASIAADQDQGITLAQLRMVDEARPHMERLVARIGGLCIATVRVGDELAVAASAGQGRTGSTATLVGQRLPFIPPTGAVFGAWLPADEQGKWVARGIPERSASSSVSLAEVRDRGYSVGLRNDAQRMLSERLIEVASQRQHRADLGDLIGELAFDPPVLSPDLLRDIRLISAPVFDGYGNVVLALTLYDFPKPSEGGIETYIEQVVDTAAAVSADLGARPVNEVSA